MLRELTSHRVNGLNEALQIQVLDAPGSGNASHEYAIINCHAGVDCRIDFQNGPIGKSDANNIEGVNGISQEALLAIVEDRLIGFQSGPFACRENAVALTKIQEAMMWLHKRTNDRMKRGVEGTLQK